MFSEALQRHEKIGLCSSTDSTYSNNKRLIFLTQPAAWQNILLPLIRFYMMLVCMGALYIYIYRCNSVLLNKITSDSINKA